MTYLIPAETAVREALHDRVYPADVTEMYLLCGELYALLRGLGALTERLAGRVGALADDRALRVDTLGQPAEPAKVTKAAAERLATAASVLNTANSAVDEAWNGVSRLYLDPEGLR